MRITESDWTVGSKNTFLPFHITDYRNYYGLGKFGLMVDELRVLID